MFADQVSALLEGGVDLFVLETFSDISELHQAIRAVRELCDLPIVAQVTIQLDGSTSFGTTADVFTRRLDEWGADVIGLNCGVGPAIVLNAIEKMRTFTERKLSAQPNAGLPRDVGGRQIYMCSPEYMAEYSRRIVQAGAKFVGYFLAAPDRCDVTVFEARADDEAQAFAPRRIVLQIAAGGRSELPVGPDAALAIACDADATSIKIAPQMRRLRSAQL